MKPPEFTLEYTGEDGRRHELHVERTEKIDEWAIERRHLTERGGWHYEATEYATDLSLDVEGAVALTAVADGGER